MWYINRFDVYFVLFLLILYLICGILGTFSEFLTIKRVFTIYGHPFCIALLTQRRTVRHGNTSKRLSDLENYTKTQKIRKLPYLVILPPTRQKSIRGDSGGMERRRDSISEIFGTFLILRYFFLIFFEKI